MVKKLLKNKLQDISAHIYIFKTVLMYNFIQTHCSLVLTKQVQISYYIILGGKKIDNVLISESNKLNNVFPECNFD